MPGMRHVRDGRDTGRDVLVSVELLEEVPGDAEREEVDRHPAHDLVRPQMDRPVGVEEPEEATGEHRDENADDPAATLVGAVDAPEGAHQHHPLEPDVHDSAPLRDHAAERAERERRREHEHLRDQVGREDDLEVARARSGRQVAEREADHARRDRTPAGAARAARDRPQAGGDREDPEQDRHGRRARRERRDRAQEGDETEDAPGDGDRLRPQRPVGLAERLHVVGHVAAVPTRRRSFRRAFQT